MEEKRGGGEWPPPISAVIPRRPTTKTDRATDRDRLIEVRSGGAIKASQDYVTTKRSEAQRTRRRRRYSLSRFGKSAFHSPLKTERGRAIDGDDGGGGGRANNDGNEADEREREREKRRGVVGMENG